MATRSKECTDAKCIQGPYILMIQKDIKDLNEKFDTMVKHNEELGKERDSKTDEFQNKILEKFDQLDDKFVSKKSVILVISTIGYASVVAIAIWQILEWYSTLHK